MQAKIVLAIVSTVVIFGAVIFGVIIFRNSATNNITMNDVNTQSGSNNDTIIGQSKNQKKINGKSRLTQEDNRQIYKVSPAEVTQFYQRMGDVLSQDNFKDFKNRAEEVRQKYPEGYFVLVKMCSRDPYSCRAYYQQDLQNGGISKTTFGTIIHEMTHVANNQCLYYDNNLDCNKGDYYIFFINNLLVKIPHNANLEELILSMTENIKANIKNPYEFDNTYLSKDTGGPSYSTLDEINAYIKTLRYGLAIQDNEVSVAQAVESIYRLLYHFNLTMIEARKNLDAWNVINQDRSFVTTALKIRQNALRLIAQVDKTNFIKTIQDPMTSKYIQENKKLMEGTSYIIDKLDNSYVNSDWKDLANINIKIKPFNQLGEAGKVYDGSALTSNPGNQGVVESKQAVGSGGSPSEESPCRGAEKYDATRGICYLDCSSEEECNKMMSEGKVGNNSSMDIDNTQEKNAPFGGGADRIEREANNGSDCQNGEKYDSQSKTCYIECRNEEECNRIMNNAGFTQ